MNLLSWVMCTWSALSMWLMSSGRYRLAWTSSFASQFGWAWLAYASGLWGMFAYSGVMLVFAVRGLRRAFRTESQ